jgi:hypothetical protein
MILDIEDLCYPNMFIGDIAEVTINNKKGVYKHDGIKWILQSIWVEVEDDLSFDKVITPNNKPSSSVFGKIE